MYVNESLVAKIGQCFFMPVKKKAVLQQGKTAYKLFL
jgi:hypothetical protein